MLDDVPRDLMDIFLACYELNDRRDDTPFRELLCEVNDEQFVVVLKKLEALNYDDAPASEPGPRFVDSRQPDQSADQAD